MSELAWRLSRTLVLRWHAAEARYGDSLRAGDRLQLLQGSPAGGAALLRHYPACADRDIDKLDSRVARSCARRQEFTAYKVAAVFCCHRD